MFLNIDANVRFRTLGLQPPKTYSISCFPDFCVNFSRVISLMRNFCNLPVTVIGNESTKKMSLGTLKCAMLSWQGING
jgi:hypothetical protein